MSAPVATRPSPQSSPAPPNRWTPGRLTRSVLVGLLAGGLLGALAGLVLAGPRRSACTVCGRHRRRWAAVGVVLAVLTVVGVAVRLAGDAAVPACPAPGSITSGGYLEGGSRGGAVGTTAPRIRAVLTAPESGLAVGWARLRGETLCGVGHPQMTLAFVPGARAAGGSTVGDVFVTSVRPDLTNAQAESLARHESRHADQWAALTAAGGIALLPVAYLVDDSLFPGSANHFEQAAGLAAGGYPPPSDPPSPPRPFALTAWLVVAAVCLRATLRAGCRAVVRGGVTRAPGRCARHTPGWC